VCPFSVKAARANTAQYDRNAVHFPPFNTLKRKWAFSRMAILPFRSNHEYLLGKHGEWDYQIDHKEKPVNAVKQYSPVLLLPNAFPLPNVNAFFLKSVNCRMFLRYP